MWSIEKKNSLSIHLFYFSCGLPAEVRLLDDPLPGGGREHGLPDGAREEADAGHDPGAGEPVLHS